MDISIAEKVLPHAGRKVETARKHLNASGLKQGLKKYMEKKKQTAVEDACFRK